jgi:hypothetical protein
MNNKVKEKFSAQNESFENFENLKYINKLLTKIVQIILPNLVQKSFQRKHCAKSFNTKNWR